MAGPLDVWQQALLSVAGGALGGLSTHRLSLARDRRKDRNAAADPIRQWLVNEERAPSPTSELPSAADVDRLCQFLPTKERSAFRDAWIKLDHVRVVTQKVPGAGGIGLAFGDPDAVRVRVRKCLPFARLI